MNNDLDERLLAALGQSQRGETVDLGDFTHYVEEEDER